MSCSDSGRRGRPTGPGLGLGSRFPAHGRDYCPCDDRIFRDPRKVWDGVQIIIYCCRNGVASDDIITGTCCTDYPRRGCCTASGYRSDSHRGVGGTCPPARRVGEMNRRSFPGLSTFPACYLIPM